MKATIRLAVDTKEALEDLLEQVKGKNIPIIYDKENLGIPTDLKIVDMGKGVHALIGTLELPEDINERIYQPFMVSSSCKTDKEDY